MRIVFLKTKVKVAMLLVDDDFWPLRDLILIDFLMLGHRVANGNILKIGDYDRRVSDIYSPWKVQMVHWFLEVRGGTLVSQVFCFMETNRRSNSGGQGFCHIFCKFKVIILKTLMRF
jgi:hypothetical protein